MGFSLFYIEEVLDLAVAYNRTETGIKIYTTGNKSSETGNKFCVTRNKSFETGNKFNSVKNPPPPGLNRAKSSIFANRLPRHSIKPGCKAEPGGSAFFKSPRLSVHQL